MDIFSPDYGYQLLSKFSNVTKYDHRNKTKDQNPLGHVGITVLIYDNKYSSSINYQNDRILFKIEDDYYKYINNNIFHEYLTKSHYDYFIDVLTYLVEHKRKISELSSGFRHVLPVSYIRDAKISQLYE